MKQIRKKGFTLVEIIICIALISTIATVSFIIINKKDDSKTLDQITKKILKAAEVYVNIEKDDMNNTYEHGIKNGAKGVQINLATLVNKGYVEKSDADFISSKKSKNINKLYVLATLSTSAINDKETCGTGNIKYTPSWQDTTNTIYLCGYKEETVDTDIKEDESGVSAKTDIYSLIYDESKIPVTKNYYDSLSDDKKAFFSYKDNGWKSYINQKLKTAYIFARGNVTNNYVKLGKDKNGNDLIWRILWKKTTFEDGDYLEYKLVLDKTVPIVLKDTNGREVSMLGKTQYYLSYTNSPSERYHQKAVFTYSNLDKVQVGGRNTYTYTVDHKFDSFFEYGQNSDDKDYYEYLNNWYDSTNLDSEYNDLIKTTANFCEEDSYDDRERYYYSQDFNCVKGNYKNDVTSYISYSNYVGRKVGMLSYGDVFLAGITKVTENLIKNDNNFTENYLMSDKKPFLLANAAVDGASYYSKYYVNIKTGISSATTSTWSGNSSHNEYIAVYNGTEIFHHSSNQDGILTTIFVGDLKPVIVVDSLNYNLSGEGTKEKPYEFIKK